MKVFNGRNIMGLVMTAMIITAGMAQATVYQAEDYAVAGSYATGGAATSITDGKYGKYSGYDSIDLAHGDTFLLSHASSDNVTNAANALHIRITGLEASRTYALNVSISMQGHYNTGIRPTSYVTDYSYTSAADAVSGSALQFGDSDYVSDTNSIFDYNLENATSSADGVIDIWFGDTSGANGFMGVDQLTLALATVYQAEEYAVAGSYATGGAATSITDGKYGKYSGYDSIDLAHGDTFLLSHASSDNVTNAANALHIRITGLEASRTYALNVSISMQGHYNTGIRPTSYVTDYSYTSAADAVSGSALQFGDSDYVSDTNSIFDYNLENATSSADGVIDIWFGDTSGANGFMGVDQLTLTVFIPKGTVIVIK